MPLTIIEHPLAKDCLAKLRDKQTGYKEYNRISKQLATLMAIYATDNLITKPKEITTPLATTTAQQLTSDIILLPILRAGLCMLAPIAELLTDATTGFIGLKRNANKFEPDQYYINIPQHQSPNSIVLILDPMVATGGSASATIQQLIKMGFSSIKLLSFLVAQPGVDLLLKNNPSLEIFTVGLDQDLNNKNYIVPGLGDFGDRLYGTS